MERPNPPFRADHIGSLIRPDWLIDAKKQQLSGKLPIAELRPLEDRAIREVVALQESVRLHSVTDGEFRRLNYRTEFLVPIGVEFFQGASPDMVYHSDDGRTMPATLTKVNRKIAWTGSVDVPAFSFLKTVTK